MPFSFASHVPYLRIPKDTFTHFVIIRFTGKTFHAAAAHYSLEEIVTSLSKSAGQTIVYKQIPVEDFKNGLSFLGPLADIFVDGFKYGDEYGYFGPGSEESVAWAAANARGKLSTFEEFLEAHPFRLE